jgi:NADPH-dependent ferric siderophore reductase
VGFGTPGHDDHVRIYFPAGRPETAEKMREFPSREFTPLYWGEDWLELEFAVHGDEGVAGLWAATAPIGSLLGIGGPRGSMRIDGTPDAWFLAGDETAIPQIRRAHRSRHVGTHPRRGPGRRARSTHRRAGRGRVRPSRPHGRRGGAVLAAQRAVRS